MKNFSLKFFLMLLVCLSCNNVFAQWQSIGTNGLMATNATDQSVAIDANGTTYIAYRDEANGFKATVKKFNGFSWETIGTGFSVSYASSLSLALDNNTPYVAFIDQGNQSNAVVKKFNGSSWTEVGTTNFAVNYATGISLSIDKNSTVYVAFADKDKENKATVKKFNGSNWENVGSAGFTAGAANSISFKISNKGVPYLAYADEAIGGQATVRSFDGTNWIMVGTAGFTEQYVTGLSLAIDNNNTPYVLFRDEANNYKASVKKFNGNNWINVGPAGFSTGVIYHTSLAVGGSGTPYVSYVDYGNGAIGNKGTVQVKRFDGSLWDNVGPSDLFASSDFDLALTLDANSFPYIAYSDKENGYKVTVVNLASSVPFLNAISDNTGFKEDRITSDQTLVLSGNSAMNATIQLFKEGVQIGQTQANVDGKWSFDYSGTTLPEGNHIFTATALVNNITSNQSKNFEVTIDATAPQIPTLTSVNGQNIGLSPIHLNGKATFIGTAEAKSMVTLFAGVTKLDSAIADDAGAWTITNIALADDIYAITASSKDIAGNAGTASQPVNIAIDTKAPAVPTVALVTVKNLKAQTLSSIATTNNVNYINTTTPTLTGTSEANATVNLFVDGNKAASIAADSTGNWTYTFVSPLEVGKRIVTANASDKANNNSEQSVSLTLLADTIAPEVTGVIEGGLYNTSKVIYFKEGNATLNNIAYSSGTTIIAEGDYTLIVTDAADNVTIVRFTIDKTKPNGTLVINSNAALTNNTQVTLSLTSQGEATAMRFLNNGVWTNWEPVAPTKAWIISTGDGSKTASGQFRDAAGNISNTLYDGIVLDQKAPTTTLTTTAVSPTNATAISVVVRFSEVIKGFDLSNVVVSNGEISNFVNGSNLAFTLTIKPIATGTITVKVAAGASEDAAGNKSLEAKSLNINFVGLAAPTVTTNAISSLGVNSATLGGNVTATGNLTVTDRGVVYSKSGTPTISNTKVGIGSGVGAFSKTITGLAPGTYYVRAYAINSKGTSYGSLQTFSIKDITAPVVTGVTEGGLYNTSKVIYFNEGIATLNNTAYVSGTTIIAEGAYTIIVTDVAGNATTMRFTIDKTKPVGQVVINNNASVTNITEVTLNITAQGEATTMRFLNNGVWTSWEPVAPTKIWTLPTGNGSKSISGQMRDAAGNVSNTFYDYITLKTLATAARIEQEVKAEVVIKDVAIYPNPAVDKLYIEVSEAGTGETTIQLIELTGKVALIQKVATTNSLNTVLNVDQLQPGVYVLNIDTQLGRVSRRVIIK